jgi:CheY-like chemotaxis protein
MQLLRILIVEDDQSKRDDYSRFIKAYNLDNKEQNIEEVFGVDKDDAIAKLQDSKNNYDGAIVDLDLMGSGGTDNSGNEVIKEIKENLRFPIFVITGTPHHISEELNVPNSIFGVFERDEVDLDNIFNRFCLIKGTGILNLLNRNGRVEELIQNIFWNHISTSLDSWVLDEIRKPEEKEDSLLRYTILHMLEYLDENNVHPSEFYITRPVKKQLSTGDLIYWNGIRYVILTPACDFVFRPKGDRNVRNAFLLKIIELTDHFLNLEESIQKGEISSNLKEKLEKVITNNKPYYHFIPKHNTIKGGIIDFQDKLSIPIEEIEAKIKTTEIDRFATISLPFLKDLIERYSSYYARQGSPDFDLNEIINSIIKP